MTRRRRSLFTNILRGTGTLGALLMVACTPESQTSSTPAPATPANELGRYQIIVAPDGDRGSMLFLLDTAGGQSWIYRPPQGSAINGFWSDIPRLTYAPDYWKSVFAGAASAASGAGQTGAPAGVTTQPRR